MCCYYLGIAHPPGYPLFTMLGKIFIELIPWGSIAFRVHLMSACFGAGTCMAGWYLVRMLTGSRSAAYAMSLGYAFSSAFWSQAIIANVYSMNTFFFFVLLCLSLKYIATRQNIYLYFLAGTFGLSLANHWPLLLLSSPCLFLILWPCRKKILAKIPVLLLLTLVGLLPYIYLFWRSQMNPEVSFMGPIKNLDQFWFFISRQGYRHIERSSQSAGWYDRLLFARFFCLEVLRQYSYLGAILVLIGFIVQWKRWAVCLSLALVMGFLGSSLILIFLLDVDFDFLSCGWFRVYPLIPYGIMGIWLAGGLVWLTEKIKALRESSWMKPVVSLAVIAVVFSVNFKYNQRRNYTYAIDYAKVILNSLDKNAVLFTCADLDLGPIGYANKIENIRPDVEIFNSESFVFKNRLFAPTMNVDIKKKAISEFVEATNRTIYHISPLLNPYTSENCCLYSKVNKKGCKGVKTYSINLALLEYLDRVESYRNVQDIRTQVHRNKVLFGFGSSLAVLVYTDSFPAHTKEFQKSLERVTKYYYGKLGLIHSLMYAQEKELKLLKEISGENKSIEEILWKWSKEAITLLDQTVLKRDHAKLYEIRAYIRNRMMDSEGRIENLKKSISIYPNARNASVRTLMSVYSELGKDEELVKLKARFQH